MLLLRASNVPRPPLHIRAIHSRSPVGSPVGSLARALYCGRASLARRDPAIVDRTGLPGTRWTTLPEHFKKSGWWTVGAGKLFHPTKPPNDDNPTSWSANLTDFGGNQGCTCPQTGVPGAPMYCVLPEDTDCPDVVIAQTVVGQLRDWKANHSHQPFFVGLGIHKPHLPWGVPKSFFDLYPAAAALPLAKHKLVPARMPAVAYHHCQWGPFPWNSSHGATTSTSF